MRSTCLACVFLAYLANVALAAEPPNIIFVMTDDQAPWAFGAAGNPEAHTPNMDRLARQGATFTNCFVTTPVCSPSRAALMASRYGTELGITDWLCPVKRKYVIDESHLGLDPSIVTWPAVLAANGYATALVGKWHLGVQDRFHPTQFGYDRFVGFRSGGSRPQDPTLEIDGKDTKCEGLLTDILTDHAINFVREHADRRFMLSLHYRAPHAPWLPVADADWAPYADLEPTIPNPDYPDLDVTRLKKMMREYLASTTGVDRNLGRLMAVLDELRLSDNTVLIYTSDHGYNMGHNGIWHKGNGHWATRAVRGLRGYDARVARPNLYDHSMRVPTIVRWPGTIRPGTRIEHTITNLDWYPTLVAIGGGKLPEKQLIRGRNFLPLLRGESVEWDDDLYGEYSQHHYTRAHLRTYRTPAWKLIRDFKNAGKDELYHLADDPAENRNLIDDPAHETIRRKLDAKLRGKMKEAGDALAETSKATEQERVSRYTFRDEHDRNGIGKFYMGREIAQVMGHLGAEWLDRPEREREEAPSRMIEALDLKPGDVVADIGAGTGYFSFRIADKVGPDGRVLAVDIQPEMLAIIRERMKERGLTNIEPILGTDTDPKLPAGSVDLILMVDVYHEFSHPWEMTVALIRALKPGGRLVFVEFRLEDPTVPIKLVHKMSEKQVRRETAPHPVRWVKTIGVLPRQHIIVFEKPDGAGRG